MLCSVIIPLYNKAVFIEAALQSVLAQRYGNFEVIVVDDGSQDDGPSRVRAIKDPRIQLIRQANMGVSCARNRGIRQAKGDLVCFLDADDWYLPAYLETIVSMATQHPEIAFFGTGFRRMSARSDTVLVWDCGATETFELVDDFFYRWRCFGPFLCTNSVAVRRQSLTAFQPCFPPGESMAEDQDLWFRLAEKFQLLYCPALLVAYRVEVEASLCAGIESYAHDLLPAFCRLEQRARDRQMPERLLHSALRLVTEKRITVARAALISGRRLDAITELLNIRYALASRRWWVSMAMCMLGWPSVIRRWEQWRRQRVRNW